MKEMKKRGARLVPQLKPEMQEGEVFMQSYIINYQSSPVDNLKSTIRADPKLLKLRYSSSSITPVLIPLNMNTPRMEKIKRTRINKANTFNRDDIEKVIV